MTDASEQTLFFFRCIYYKYDSLLPDVELISMHQTSTSTSNRMHLLRVPQTNACVPKWKWKTKYYQNEITYCTKSFQNGKKACNPEDPPGKPVLLELKDRKLYFLQGRKLSVYWNIYIYTLIWLSCLLATRTEENSKAKGYILNNCETQSTHCIGHPNITS